MVKNGKFGKWDQRDASGFPKVPSGAQSCPGEKHPFSGILGKPVSDFWTEKGHCDCFLTNYRLLLSSLMPDNMFS